VLQPLAPTEIASDLRELAVGQSLNMMGHPNGIPLKIDQNGRITFLDQSQRSGFFNLSIDAFGGNSGSGIYDQSGKVRGILVRGRTDYEFNEQRQCNEVATAAIDAMK
jgi:V8-like Glu-specific endopeptidase